MKMVARPINQIPTVPGPALAATAIQRRLSVATT
jgi:hypothetical protein